MSEFHFRKKEGRKETVKERTQENPCESEGCDNGPGRCWVHLPLPGVKHFTQDLTLPQSVGREGPGESLQGARVPGVKTRGMAETTQQCQASTLSPQVIWYGKCYGYSYSRILLILNCAWPGKTLSVIILVVICSDMVSHGSNQASLSIAFLISFFFFNFYLFIVLAALESCVAAWAPFS